MTYNQHPDHALLNARTVCHAIERWAQIQPDHTAVSFGDRLITYAQLDAAGTHVAWLLSQHGIGPGSKVPVLARRCPEMIACFLGVLKVGALYVPIDTESWSTERIEWTLQRVSAQVILNTTSKEYPGYFEISCGVIEASFCLNTTYSGMEVAPEDFRPWDSIHPQDDLAYIIFTSGTTSTPKGVMIAHSSLLNYTQQGGSETPYNFNATPADHVVLIFSPAFDACTGVIFATLCNGAALRVATAADFVHSVTMCNIVMCTPSVMSTIQDTASCSKLRMIVLGGEAPPMSLVRKWQKVLPDCEVWNFYGPTETTCASLAGRLRLNEPIHLGHPMVNSRVLLVDGDEEGDYGEMYITGPGLAKGYFDNEELTAEKFVYWRGERAYRTGDFGRRTPLGIDFVGRKDSLIKNRGFLVNLDSQVIPLLSENEQVSSATAFMYQGRLHGFVSPATVDTKALRQSLAANHDAFVVPDSIRAMDVFPLTPNGKIDSRLLQRELDSELAASIDIDSADQGHGKVDILKASLSSSLAIPLSQIPMDQSFQELGGTSLVAMRVQSFLRKRSLEVRMVDIFKASTLASLCNAIHDVAPDTSANSGPQSNGDQPLTTSGPASTTQLKMIQAGLKRPETSYMLMRFTFPHPNVTNVAGSVRAALRLVLERHSSFKTSFSLKDGLQHVNDELNLSWLDEESTEDDLEKIVDARSEALRQAISATNHSETYIPITACNLVTVPRRQSTLLMLVHHSLIDGWSLSIILNEFRLALDGKPLPPSPPQYVDAAVAQRMLANDTKGKEFWNDLLKDGLNQPALTLLPSSAVNEDQASGWSSSMKVGLNLERSTLDTKAKLRGVTPASIFYLAWALVLSHHTFTDDVSFGVVLSGRNMAIPRVDEVVGPMLSTCPFPLDFGTEGSIARLLATTQQRLLNIMEHQWSADESVSKLPPGSIANTFQSIVVMEYDLPAVSKPCEALSHPWKIERKDCMEFGLSVLVEEDEHDKDALQVRILFDGFRYAASSIQVLLTQFRNGLQALLDERNSHVQQVRESMVQLQECSDATRATSRTPDPYGGFGFDTVKDAFDSAASRWPELTAVESAAGSMTYRQLDRAANRIAHHLRFLIESSSGANNERHVVAVLTDGSLYWIVSLLAVLKAGCICCPVDVNLPASRIDTIMEQSGASISLAANKFCASFARNRQAETIVCSDFLSTSIDPCTNLDIVTNPKDVIYLVFTSGSTGIPKGVALHNQSLLLVIDHEPARLFTRPGRRNSQVYAVGFDVATVEIFGTLCYGGTLVLKDPADPFRHMKTVDASFSTPSLLAALSPDDFPNLQTVVLAGEPVPQSLADAWSDRQLYNGYGPSECAPLSTMAHLRPGESATIGHAMPHLNVYLLDHHMCPVPPGVTGEIYLSGEQMTRGYWNSPKQTQRSFLPNSFSPGDTMYKTGDLGRWTSNGSLAYIGRVDNQVKVRGFRIELEEVERALVRADPAIQRAAAIVVDSVRIVAFVTPSDIDTSAVALRLKDFLPAYTRPAQTIALGELPKSTNLKTDRKALQLLAIRFADQGELPSTDTEKMVAQVWRKVLNTKENYTIKREDDFLGIGGNSLLAIRAARLLSDSVGQRVPVPMLIRETVLHSLATAIDTYTSQEASKERSASFVSYLANMNPSPEMEHSQPLSQMEEEFHSWHVQALHKSLLNTAFQFELNGSVNVSVLKQAFESVVAENAILRARYVPEGNSISRHVIGSVVAPLVFNGDQLNSEALQALVEEPFDVTRDQLFRVVIWERAAGSVTLVLITHHVITDKASLALLLQSVSKHYNSGLDMPGDTYDRVCSAPKASYIEWARWQRQDQQAPSTTTERQKEKFWRDRLQGTLSRIPRAVDYSVGSVSSRHWYAFIPQLGGVKASQRIAMAATALAMKAVYGMSDMVLGLPYMNRDEPGAADLMGLFLDRLPIRLTLDNSTTCTAANLLEYTASEIHLAVENNLAYYQILDAAGKDTSVFDVMVIYHWQSDALEHSLELPDTRVSSTPVRAKGAKFPLQLEFTEQKEGGLRLDVEYDSGVILPAQFAALKSFVPLAVEALVRHIPPTEILTRFEAQNLGPRLASTEAVPPAKEKDGRGKGVKRAFVFPRRISEDSDSAISVSFEPPAL